MSDVENLLKEELENLPPLPESVVRIQAICDDPDSAVRDLADVVERDPLLTANLLRAVNAPFYGYSGRIANVAQAISLFGMRTVLGFAVAGAVRSSFAIDLSPYGITPDQFADAAQMRSSLALHWYRRGSRRVADILVPAAFMAGIGMVVAAKVLTRSSEGEAFSAALDENPGSQGEVEVRFTGICSEEISARMLETWCLNRAVFSAIRQSALPLPPSEEAAALATITRCVTRAGRVTDTSREAGLALLNQAGLAEQPFLDALDVIGN